MQNLEELKALLNTPQKQSVVIVPHSKPDADALGSSLAMAAYLRKKGFQPTVISPTDYPDFLKWMDGEKDVLIFENPQHQLQAHQCFAEASLLFCLDYSAMNRVGDIEPLIRQFQGKIIVIDHHQGKEDFAHFELWHVEAAATCELVYDFIYMMGDEKLIDIPIAECLYAGIMTDTGSFKHASTSSRIHRIAAELKDLGIDSARIHHLIYDNHTLERMRFLGFALSRKLKVLPEYHCAYFAISDKELKKYESKTGDTEGVVNYALSIKDISIAAIFIERKEGIKISFRSFGEFSVADFAAKYFNGGGHKNAAGGLIKDKSLKQTVNYFIEKIKHEL